MAVEQNDFRYLMPTQLSGATQAQHVPGVLPLALAPNLHLAGKERLKPSRCGLSRMVMVGM